MNQKYPFSHYYYYYYYYCITIFQDKQSPTQKVNNNNSKNEENVAMTSQIAVTPKCLVFPLKEYCIIYAKQIRISWSKISWLYRCFSIFIILPHFQKFFFQFFLDPPLGVLGPILTEKWNYFLTLGPISDINVSLERTKQELKFCLSW